MRVCLVTLAILTLTGCSKYADFTLPPPESAGPRAPFHWSSMPDPVIQRADAVDVLNPSVVKLRGVYENFFSAFDGKNWSTRLATSEDGVAWKPAPRLDLPLDGGIAANGSALIVGNNYFYWYQTGSPAHIALTREKFPKPISVLEPGPLGSFDESAVADPYVIRAGEDFYLFYLGQDRAQRQRLGIAQSYDGIHWQKFRSNPILDSGAPGAFDENGLGEPAVWTSGGSYWMLYTGRARDESRRLGLAKSTDGVHWQRDPSLPPIAGDQPWNRAVMCDPSVEVLPDTAGGRSGVIRVWFGGGDVPRPDQNIHGQIGLGFLQ